MLCSLPVPDPRSRSRRRIFLLATALVLALATLAATAGAQPPAAVPARPLTLSVGPRDGGWKRVLTPRWWGGDARCPGARGISEPLLVYNRATATYMPWLGTRYDWSENNRRL